MNSNYTHTTHTIMQPTVTTLLELQHKSSMFLRSIPFPEEPTTLTGTKDSSSESTCDNYCKYGPLGHVECSLENLKGLEKMGEWFVCGVVCEKCRVKLCKSCQ